MPRTLRHTTASLLLQFTAACAAIVLSGCGAAAPARLAEGDSSRVAAMRAALPGIPIDLPGLKTASAQSDTVLNGIDATDKSAGTSAIGNILRIAAGPGGLEYAIYQHHLGGDSMVSVAAALNVGSGTETWFGIANYGSLHWDFAGPYPASGTPEFLNLSGGDYSSAADNAYVVVITFDSTIATVQTVTFTTDSVPPVTYSISGTVTDSGDSSPMQGVQIVVNPGNLTTTTAANGTYTVSNLVAGNYTVAAGFTGYLFSPAPANVSLGPDAAGVDFTGSVDVNTYSISGQVTDTASGFPLSGVVVTLQPGGLTDSTDINGDYSFANLNAGPYSVSASLAGYTILPGNQDVTVGPDASGIDFAATLIPITYTIGGTITNSAGGGGLAGVAVTINPGNHQTTTNSSGKYSVSGLNAGNYTVTPSFTGFDFNPVSQNISVGPDQNSVDFVGTAQSQPVTYTNDTKAIFDSRCIGCHSGNFPSGGLKLDNYNDCKNNIDNILTRVDSDNMPKGGPPLTQGQKDTLHAWKNDGLLL